MDESIHHMSQSILTDEHFPYDHTLYLDADTLVCDDVSDMFSILERVDLALAQDFIRGRGNREVYERNNISLPTCFTEFNSGVMVYNDTPEVHQLFESWKSIFMDMQANVNQPALRKALYQSDVDFLTLPPEYNFTLHSVGFACGPVKIVHRGKSDFDLETASRMLNKVVENRVMTWEEDPCRIIPGSYTSKQYRLARSNDLELDSTPTNDISTVSDPDVGATTFPTVSVLTPTYDQDSALGDAIESVRNQTYSDFEHLVLDGAQQASTAEIVHQQEADHVEYIPMESYSDPVPLLNHGLEVARGDFLTVLNVVDEFAPPRLEVLLGRLKSLPDTVGGILHSYKRVTSDGSSTTVSVPDMDQLGQGDLLYKPDLSGTSNAMYRTSVVETLGGWDESMRSWADLDLQLRMLRDGTLSGVSPILSFHVASPSDRHYRPAEKSVAIREAGPRFIARHGDMMTPSSLAEFYYQLEQAHRNGGDDRVAAIQGAKARLNRGIASLWEGDSDRARNAFEEAIDLAPNDKRAEFLQKVAFACLDQGNVEQARNYYIMSAKLSGLSMRTLSSIGGYTQTFLPG